MSLTFAHINFFSSFIFSDHEYEPIGEPVPTTTPIIQLPPNIATVVQFTEPYSEKNLVTTINEKISNENNLPIPDVDVDEQEERTIEDIQREIEARFRSVSPPTDRTEDIHTSQIDSSGIEELPLRREDRKKGFMSSAGERTKNFQNKLSSHATNLRTKFKRKKKPPKSESLKSSPISSLKSSPKSSLKTTPKSSLPSSLKSSPRSSPKQSPKSSPKPSPKPSPRPSPKVSPKPSRDASPSSSLRDTPKEKRKFKAPEFSRLKNIHMPEFKRPEFTKFKKPDFKFTKPDMSKFKIPASLKLHRSHSLQENTLETEDTPDTGQTCTVVTTETTVYQQHQPQESKKKFDFGTYPKIFDRFKKQPKEEKSRVSSKVTEDGIESSETPGSSVQFATVPRAAVKNKGRGILTKWTRQSSETSYTDNDSGNFRRFNSEQESVEHEDSLERRMRIALKNSMEDEEEPLGILQTEEQIQLASYDQENRAIHEISRAREGEFKSRKPLVHQESDLVSEESNKDLDWEECERLRAKILGNRSNDLNLANKTESIHNEPVDFPSNLSTQETQSSGSSGERRRTGVIEEIDDDEFFLRQRGISQDNIQFGQYISSAIREGLESPPSNALADLGRYDRYSDENFDISNERVNYGYDIPPRKPKRSAKIINKSYSEDYPDSRQRSFDGDFKYTNELDREVPVATEYFSRYDDDDDNNGSFYENEHMEGIEQPDIMVTSIDNDELEFQSRMDKYLKQSQETPPKPPKRKRKGRDSEGRDSIRSDSVNEKLTGRSVSDNYLHNGDNDEVRIKSISHQMKNKKILRFLCKRL